MKKIGAITVGQTPRTDLIPEIAPILGDSIEIIQMGGLDGLTKEEIQTMTPAPGDHVLVSRLKDGSSVSFGESHILPRLEACMDQLKKDQVSLILFLCTGEFPAEFRSNVPLIFPDHILKGLIPAIGVKNLSVIIPTKEQEAQMPGKWKDCCDSLHVTSVSPYGDPLAVFAAAKEIPADTVVLATGFVENNSLFHTLQDMGKEVYLVGDAKKSPGNIMHAVADGNRVGREI